MSELILIMTICVALGGFSAIRSMYRPNRNHYIGGFLWLCNAIFLYNTNSDETGPLVPLIVLEFTIAILLFISSLRARFDNEK